MTVKGVVDARVAGLKRKVANTFEPAKRAELVNELRNLGHEFRDEAEQAVGSVVPVGRTASPLVTADAPAGDKQTAAVPPVSTEVTQETAANSDTPRRSPGRPRKDQSVS